ncbi:MAG: hypothetical protein M0R77_03010 [Gammaproteobacteria bacterium]|nr:hypothetical protein [Gammaproteobacteria bacterium]
MEIKEFHNRIILWARGNPNLYPEEIEQIENFGKLLRFHGIEYTEGKFETLKESNVNYGIQTIHVLHLLFDDANFTAYKIIKD